MSALFSSFGFGFCLEFQANHSFGGIIGTGGFLGSELAIRRFESPGNLKAARAHEKAINGVPGLKKIETRHSICKFEMCCNA